MNLYLADVRRFNDETLYDKGHMLLPGERQERIARFRNPADRRRSLCAGLLLEYGLRECGISLLADVPGCEMMQVEYGAHGKPRIGREGAPCFSLSHAGDYAVALFAEGAVGIDIERIRPVRPAVARRCFSAEEQAYLDAHAGEDAEFTRLWTRKESYIKAVGEGMYLPLADFSVLGAGVGEYGLYTFPADAPGMPEGYVMSVCAACPVEVVIRTVEFDLEKDGFISCMMS